MWCCQLARCLSLAGSFVFLSLAGDYFTFNQPNIKYLYVICCFYTLGLADSKKFHHVCKFIFAIIFAIMLTCNFFARNQQKHHLAVELLSFKEAATFGSRSTEEFCATRGILRAPFWQLFLALSIKNRVGSGLWGNGPMGAFWPKIW